MTATSHSRSRHILSYGASTFLVMVVLLAPAGSAADPSSPASLSLPETEHTRIVARVADMSTTELARLVHSTGEARSCRWANEKLSCTCVEVSLGSWRIRVDEWSSDLPAAGVFASDGSRWWFARSLTREAIQDLWYSPAGSSRVLHADSSELDASSMTDVAWYDTVVPPAACGETPSAEGGPSSRARSAHVDAQGRWTLRGLRVEGVPVGSARSDTPSAGLLPPTVRVDDSSAEIESTVLVWGPLGIAAHYTTSGSAGASAVVFTPDHARTHRLDTGVAFDFDDGAAKPFALGTLQLDLGAIAASARVEEPAGPAQWDVRRPWENAAFRDYRRSAAGIGLSGPHHALDAFASRLSPPDLPALSTFAASFGADHPASSRTTTSVDVAQRSQTTGDSDTSHSTTLYVSTRYLAGSAGRATLAPELAVVGNYATAQASTGFDASATLSALARVRARLEVAGKLGSVAHFVTPEVEVGRELAGIQQRQIEEGASPYEWVAPTAWSWASTRIDQRLVGRSWSLDVPAGVFVDALGDEPLAERLGDPIVFAGVGARLAGAKLRVHGLCPARSCDVPLLHGSASLPFARQRGTATYALTNFDVPASILQAVLEGTPNWPGLLARVQERGEGAPTTWAHSAAIAFAGSRWDLSGGTSLVITEPESSGVWAGAARRWALLGWSLGVSGVYRLDGSWGAAAGLRLHSL